MSQLLSVDEASRCMKCGFCMSSCPVYTVDHIESHVARGRNMLIRWAGDNSIPVDGDYGERLSYCLLCGRCEAVCPAKVPSAAITVAARTNWVSKKGLTWLQRFVYHGILKHRTLMARLLGLAARIPGVSVKDGKPLRHLADSVSIFTRGLSIPKLSRPFLSDRLPSRINPPKGVHIRGQVAIFPGCAFEFFFADVGERIALALAEAGFEVVYPQGLTCCGLAVRSAGDLTTAQLMARHNIEILSPFDHIVTGCATCSSALKDYGKWFPANDEWQLRASNLSAKVSDLSEFLVKEGFQPRPTEPVTVTYHDPCHLKWRQAIKDEPRQLLDSIEGLKYIEMDGADECCGLGGAFGITHRDISLAIQAKKMESIKKTGAQIVVTSCPGCLIQLRDGARRHGLPIEVMHISQIIGGQREQPRKLRSTGDGGEQSPHPKSAP
ncbi:MAG: (Fe-S)-binding protein [Dehalococcoidia bacterium]